jgi:hypothetical protein
MRNCIAVPKIKQKEKSERLVHKELSLGLLVPDFISLSFSSFSMGVCIMLKA